MIPRALFGRSQDLANIRRDAFLRGVRAVAPATIATGTWGLVTGVAMVKVGLSTIEAIGMSLLVFAGSAQLAALPLIAADAPVWVILLTATVVNLRFVIISAGVQPYFRHFPLGRRLMLGYLTTDIGFALFISRFARQPDVERGSTEQVWFFLGMAAGNWVAWQGLSILGIVLATQVPGAWGLEFAAILALIALTIPMINGKPALVGAATAGLVAVVAAGFPLKLGLVAAVLVGIVAAMGTELMLERSGRRR
jgi:predicted branched-subunit amino acid permease